MRAEFPDSAFRLSWHASAGVVKALFAEVAVEVEGMGDAMPSHAGKTDTVDEAEVTAARREQRRHSLDMEFGGHPDHVEQWRYVVLKTPHCRHAKAMLNERGGLDEHVARGDKSLVFLDQRAKHSSRLSVVVVGRIEHRDQCGCVDEDAHR